MTPTLAKLIVIYDDATHLGFWEAQGEEVDAGAFKALIRAAVALNTSGGKARPRRAK